MLKNKLFEANRITTKNWIIVGRFTFRNIVRWKQRAKHSNSGIHKAIIRLAEKFWDEYLAFENVLVFIARPHNIFRELVCKASNEKIHFLSCFYWLLSHTRFVSIFINLLNLLFLVLKSCSVEAIESRSLKRRPPLSSPMLRSPFGEIEENSE